MFKFSKIDKHHDKEAKELEIDEMNSLYNSLGCEIKIKTRLPTEYTGHIEGENISDGVYLLDTNEIAVIETENNKPTPYAIRKIIFYSTLVMKKYEEIKNSPWGIKHNLPKTPCIRKIMIVINATNEIEDIEISPNCNDEYLKIEVYTPYTVNGDKMLKNIKCKIKQNIKLDKNENSFFYYPFHTNFKNIEPHEMLIETAHLLNKTKFKKEIKEKLLQSYAQDCMYYVDEKYKKITLEEIEMLHTNTEKYNEELKKIGIVDAITDMKEMDAPKELIDNLIKKHGLEGYF